MIHASHQVELPGSRLAYVPCIAFAPPDADPSPSRVAGSRSCGSQVRRSTIRGFTNPAPECKLRDRVTGAQFFGVARSDAGLLPLGKSMVDGADAAQDVK